jgi:hypothetical protein
LQASGKIRQSQPSSRLIVSPYPRRLQDIGIRSAEPAEVNGYIQRPIDGTSFAYTFGPANAQAPSTRTKQYFEMPSDCAMYADGLHQDRAITARPCFSTLLVVNRPTA